MEARKIFSVLAALVLIGGVASAQTDQTPPANPGFITADNPLYPLDIAADQAAVTLGIRTASDVTEERAAEVVDAVQKGNSPAASNALNALNDSTSDVDDPSQVTGLERALDSLQKAQRENKAPGLNTAINRVKDNMEKQRDRVQSLPDVANAPN